MWVIKKKKWWECQSERGEELRAERKFGELRWPQTQGDSGGDDGGDVGGGGA